MLGGRRNGEDEAGLRAHYLTQRSFGASTNSAARRQSGGGGGGGGYAYSALGGGGGMGGSADAIFLSRALDQQGSSRKFLLMSLGFLVVFAAVFALLEEEAGDSSSSAGGVDTAALTACADVEIEGAEGLQLTLERHDDEQTHGDICRASTGAFGCPKGCSTSNGKPPYCQKRGTTKPCRVKYDTSGGKGGPKLYRCDPSGGERGVCVKAVGPVGSSKEFKGKAKYADSTCDNQCSNESQPGSKPFKSGGRLFGRSSSRSAKYKCRTDDDCSLAGTCDTKTGKCQCDAWATGVDCSYLNFQHLDPSKLGYLHEQYTSWGGSVKVGNKDGLFHMFVSEIICGKDDMQSSRCGLAKWKTNSRVAHAVSSSVEGPYTRVDTVLNEEAHNPTVAVSPVDSSWNLYSISKGNGPIEVISSVDDGYTWTESVVVSKFQNPSPFLNMDGTLAMYYRGDNGKLPSPTCSSEYIGMQHCDSKEGPCENKKSKPIFGHTAEDPMVFRDHRGNYHMLMNALPYLCVPKIKAGGHSWSKDGIHWSEPRVGAFESNILLVSGDTIQCERRERPQMIMDPKRPGIPLALVSGVTGCPTGLFPNYKGGDDSFTLVQLLAQDEQ